MEGANPRTNGTVYRDKYGRKLDLEKLRQEELLAKDERRRKLEEQRLVSKGLVQNEEENKEAEFLRRQATLPLSIYHDNGAYNSELKGHARWDDPMKAYLTSSGSKSTIKKRKKTKLYRGPPPPPNRFNIAPGYRWDGVDRGNGFEAKLLKAESERVARKELGYKRSTQEM